MKITCPTCATSYELPENSVGQSGRKVKCATCGTKWHVDPGPVVATDPVLDSVATGFTDTPEGWGDDASANNMASVERDFDAQSDEGDVSVEISDNARQALRSRLRPIDPLMRSSEHDDAETRLKAERPEDVKRLKRQKILRPLSFVVTLSFIMTLLLMREPIVRMLPDLASLYASIGLSVNLRGFEIKNVKSERVIESSGPVLIVSGELENIKGAIAQAPKLRFGLRTNTNEEIYSWDHELLIPTIVPGGTARFQSRLASPPNLGRNLSVRFTD